MRTWFFMASGLIVWAAHLLGVYGLASAADVLARTDAAPALWSIGALTFACAVADAVILFIAKRQGRRAVSAPSRFIASIAGLGAGLSLVAVIWQGLPALF